MRDQAGLTSSRPMFLLDNIEKRPNMIIQMDLIELDLLIKIKGQRYFD